MRTPPLAVKVVLEGVCILKSIPPERVPGPSGVGYVEEYWPAAKKMMGDLKFLDGLINFEKDTIPTKNIQKLQERILTNENFDPEIVKLASTACEGLCNLPPSWASEAWDTSSIRMTPATVGQADQRIGVALRSLVLHPGALVFRKLLGTLILGRSATGRTWPSIPMGDGVTSFNRGEVQCRTALCGRQAP